jgi:hypothetical protein
MRTIEHWINGSPSPAGSSRTTPIHGPEGVRFYTREKVVTSRWPHVAHRAGSHFNFPTWS